MRQDEHGRWWSEEPKTHIVYVWDDERGMIDGRYLPYEAESEAEAAEVAQDAVHECARAGVEFACIVVQAGSWDVVAEFRVRRIAHSN